MIQLYQSMIPILLILLICSNAQIFTVVRDSPNEMTNYIQLSSVLGDNFYMNMDRSAIYVEPCDNTDPRPFKVIDIVGTSYGFLVGDYVCTNDYQTTYLGNQGRYQFEYTSYNIPYQWGQQNEIQGFQQRTLVSITNGDIIVYPIFTSPQENIDNLSIYSQNNDLKYISLIDLEECTQDYISTLTLSTLNKMWYLNNNTSPQFRTYICENGTYWNIDLTDQQYELDVYDLIGQSFTWQISNRYTTQCSMKQQYLYLDNGSYKYLCFEQNNISFSTQEQIDEKIKVNFVYQDQDIYSSEFVISESDRYAYKVPQNEQKIREVYIIHQDQMISGIDANKLVRFNIPTYDQNGKQYLDKWFVTPAYKMDKTGIYEFEYGTYTLQASQFEFATST